MEEKLIKVYAPLRRPQVLRRKGKYSDDVKEYYPDPAPNGGIVYTLPVTEAKKRIGENPTRYFLFDKDVKLTLSMREPIGGGVRFRTIKSRPKVVEKNVNKKVGGKDVVQKELIPVLNDVGTPLYETYDLEDNQELSKTLPANYTLPKKKPKRKTKVQTG